MLIDLVFRTTVGFLIAHGPLRTGCGAAGGHIATLALALPIRLINRCRISSCRASHMPAQSDGRPGRSPKRRGRAGLGDVAALGATGRFLRGRPSYYGPELQGSHYWRSLVEGTDLGGNHQAPNVPDAEDALQNQLRVDELFTDREAKCISRRRRVPAAARPASADRGSCRGAFRSAGCSRSPKASSQRWASAERHRTSGRAEVGRVEHRLRHGIAWCGRGRLSCRQSASQFAELHPVADRR